VREAPPIVGAPEAGNNAWVTATRTRVWSGRAAGRGLGNRWKTTSINTSASAIFNARPNAITSETWNRFGSAKPSQARGSIRRN